MRKTSILLLAPLFSGPLHAAVVGDHSVGSGAVIHSGATYLIPQSSGKTVKTTLFQSFQSFDLSAGETAQFNGVATVRNVLARVTGGACSIDGTIRCSIQNANFYLINSAGVMFGPNAALDVGGSFAVTTANVVSLHGGPSFSATSANPVGSVLSIQSPATFGFLATQKPATIQIAGSKLSVGQGKTLSLVAGGASSGTAIRVAASDSGAAARLTASAGRINLVAVSGAGQIDLNAADTTSALVLRNFAARSGIEITGQSLINVDGPIVNPADPISGSADPRIAGGGLIVGRASTFTLHRGELSAQTFGGGAGHGVDLDLTTAFIQDAKGGIFTDTSGAGAGGSIRLVAPTVSISAPGTSENDDFGLSSQTQGIVGAGQTGAGKGGDITVLATDVTLKNAGRISTQTLSQGGDGGDINLTATHQMVIDGAGNLFFTGVTSQTKPPIYDARRPLGDATRPNNPPQQVAGSSVRGAPLVLLNPGRAGAVSINAGILSLSNSGRISSETGESGGSRGRGGAGTGGEINITATKLLLNDSPIETRKDGLVRIAPTQGGIRASALNKSTGNAGNISIDADTVELVNGGLIQALTRGTGVGGNVSVNAESVHISGGGMLPAYLTSPATPTQSVIDIETTLASSVTTNGLTLPGGRGGNLRIDTDTLTLDNGGQIKGLTTGQGAAGRIEISANTIALTGAKNAGAGLDTAIIDSVGTASVGTTPNPSSFPGDGGDIRIGTVARPVGQLTLTRGATISTSTYGTGEAADIVIYADKISQMRASSIRSDAAKTIGTGPAGNIRLVVGGVVSLQDHSTLTTQSKNGDAGAITVSFTSPAGALVLDGDSSITGDAGLTGGNITLGGSNSVYFLNGSLSSTAGTALNDESPSFGVGDGGALTLNSSLITFNHSDLNASARGRGGNISLNAGQSFLTSDTQIVSHSGIGIDGTIAVLNPIIDLGRSLVNFGQTVRSPDAMLQNACHVIAGSASSFTLEGSGGLQIDPAENLPSQWRLEHRDAN